MSEQVEVLSLVVTKLASQVNVLFCCFSLLSAKTRQFAISWTIDLGSGKVQNITS